jgi:hypothetical protein
VKPTKHELEKGKRDIRNGKRRERYSKKRKVKRFAEWLYANFQTSSRHTPESYARLAKEGIKLIEEG